MKVITGVVGGTLISVGVFLITGLFLLPLLPPWTHTSLNMGGLNTNNLLGVVLGFVAGLVTYSAAMGGKKK